MPPKSIYVSKWDAKLKKRKSPPKLKLEALDADSNLSEKQFFEQMQSKPGGKLHWCEACEL